MSTYSILLVEDNQRLAELIKEYMEKHGYRIAIETRGDHAVNRILKEQPHIVILDLMLPGTDGLEVCRSVRPDYSGAILMLTALDEDVDQIVGLELGADDYIIKPVEPRVLLARVKSHLRRLPCIQPRKIPEALSQKQLPPVFRTQALCIHPGARTVQLNNETINMTTQEFDLIWLLASHAGEVMSRDTLCMQLYGVEYNGMDRSIDILISRVRKLIQDDSDQPQYIKTIRNKGYLFAQPEIKQ